MSDLRATDDVLSMIDLWKSKVVIAGVIRSHGAWQVVCLRCEYVVAAHSHSRDGAIERARDSHFDIHHPGLMVECINKGEGI